MTQPTAPVTPPVTPPVTALCGVEIFDGEQCWHDQALVIRDGRIDALMPRDAVPADAAIVELGGGLLAPGFIDVQVNGGGGILFNDAPTVDGIRSIADAHARFGTTALLPTLITDRPAVTDAAIAAVRSALDQGVAGCLGLHLEGPFLAATRKGAHDPALIRAMDAHDVQVLTEAGVAPLVLTVAAETVPPETIRRLVDAGILVSIGHSDTDYDGAMAAFAAGARSVTHLFNAMSPLGHRAPGLVGAALDAGDVWCGLIADGFHVHPAALGIALRAKRGTGRGILVTDAMSTVGVDADSFMLNGRRVRRDAGRLTLDDGTLAGSDLTMIGAVRFMIDQVGVERDEALRMASLYPAQFLGLADQGFGRLVPGGPADIVHLTPAFEVGGVWRGGRWR